MPDLGLTKAIRSAVRAGTKGARVLRPEEKELLARPRVDDLATPRIEPAAVDPAAAPKIEPEIPAIAPPELPPPQLPGELTDEAARLTKTRLGDYDLDQTFQPNFDTIRTTDDVKAVIADTSQKYAGKIDEARRGTITNEQLRGLAEDLDLDDSTVRRVMTRETGGTLNAETILASRQMLNSSADRILTLAKKISTGQASDIDRIMFRRQLQFHGEFQTQFMGARAEAGRALNAFSIPTEINPAQLARMKEVVERMTGDTDQIAKALSEVDTSAGVSKFARQYNRSKLWGTLTETFVNSVLSGVKTFIVNLQGNVIMPAMNIAETAVAARLGKFLPGAEHVEVGEAAAMVHGTLSGVRDGLRLASKALKSGRTLDDMVKFETPQRRAISAQNLLPDNAKNTLLGRFAAGLLDGVDVSVGGKKIPIPGIGSIIRAPTERVMAPTDEFFKTIAYRADLERQAMLHVQQQLASGAAKASDAGRLARDFMENTPTTSAEAAAEYARYATFQNELGEGGKKWERALRSHPALSLIAPFIRTPINIFKAGIVNRSPLALFSKRFREDMKAGGRRRDLALARVSMGSATSAYVANEVLQGNITGGGPQDDGARQLLQAQGWQPYSKRWTDANGDTQYTSYARLEPLAFVVGATADIVEINSFLNSDVETMADEDSETWKAAAAVIAGIANNTMSKTFTKGLADFAELSSDPARYSKQWAGNMATAFIPYSSLRRQINQIEDPYMREAWTILDKIKTSSGIPGYSQDAPPRRDIYGEPRKYAAGDILGPMSPIPSSAETVDSITDELVNVMEQTRIVPVAMPGKRVENMRLTADEYDDLVRISRTEPIFGGKRTFREELERVMNSSVYQRATPVYRAELLKDTQARADEAAADKLEKDSPEFHDRLAVYRAKQDRLRFDR